LETKPDRYACVYTESDDFGKHQVVLLINKLATTGTFSPSYDPRPNQRFRKAGKKVLNRYRIQLELQEAAAAAAIHAAELAAGPPLGVSIKADAIVGVTIMKGVFCPDANGRWAERRTKAKFKPQSSGSSYTRRKPTKGVQALRRS
jgi:hypothetical protein